MKKIGLIKEGKIPADNRVALTPSQCKWINKNFPGVQVVVQHHQSVVIRMQNIKRPGLKW